MYSAFTPIGTIFYEFVNIKFKILRRTLSIAMMTSSAFIHIGICFIEEKEENLFLYVAIVALDGVFQGGTFSCISSWELSVRTSNNQEKYLVISGVRLFYSLVIFASMLAIGFLMQICTLCFIQQTEHFCFSWPEWCQSMLSCAFTGIQDTP